MGNRHGTRGESPGAKGSRPAPRSSPQESARARRSTALPEVLARRVRLRPFCASPPGPAPHAPTAALALDELLTGWLAGLRHVRAPDTLGDCADYARYLDEMNRVRHDADRLCDRLHDALAAWAHGDAPCGARRLQRPR